MYGEIRKKMGEVFHRLARQKESLIEEVDLIPDHVHMMIDTAGICGIAGSRVHQREKCDPY